MKNIPELLAPAGTLEGLKTAILYGADAVYAGLPGFSLRTRAKMNMDDMLEGIKFIRKHNKKLYIAFNLFAHERDYKNFSTVEETIKKINPDGLIISDPGVFMWAKQTFPDIALHISTQANICSAKTVQFWQNQGASLCVLAREVSHNEFCDIREKCPNVGLEIFVHGAMCMSYSGRCLMSNFITGRPANRGSCAQLCRWKYNVLLENPETGTIMPLEEDNRGAYIMNALDLCLMPRLSEVLESKPNSLKIEGRNRSEYYVGTVVRAYRNAIDNWQKNPDDFNSDEYMKDLLVLQTRGYTDAFFDGVLKPTATNFETTKSKSDFANAGVVIGYENENMIFELRNELKTGDEIVFLPPKSEKKIIVKLEKLINAKNDEVLEKFSAGQNNSIKIPLKWFNIPEIENLLPPLSISYKKL